MGHDPGNWEELLAPLLRGDELAYRKVARRVTGLLAAWGAYGFRDEWPDVVQEVLEALLHAARAGEIRNSGALAGFVRSVARNKFVDRLRRKSRAQEREARARGEELDDPPACGWQARPEVVVDVRRALDRLPEKQGRVLYAVYGEGKTYEQVAEETGIPLGSVKRYLRDGMAELRRTFAADLGAG
jgi:RNA polymerase sigma-70 factor (ECF subfamily)